MEAINFTNDPFTVVCVAFLSWPVYKYLAKIFFGEKYETLGETLHYFLQSDWHSAMKGKYWEDRDASLKLQVYIVLCIGWVIAVSELICRYKLS